MKRNVSIKDRVFVAIFLAIMMATGKSFGLSFTLIDLSPSQSGSGWAVAVNDLGQAALYWSGAGYFWDGTKNIPLGNYMQPYGINNNGWVVGQNKKNSNNRRSFVWDGNSFTDIGNLGGSYMFSRAWDINDENIVVGEATKRGNYLAAYKWDGQIHKIPDLYPSYGYGAYAINERGQIVGYRSSRAVLWEGNQIIPLPGVGYAQHGGAPAATDINDNGIIVGYGNPGGSAYAHAVMWTPDGQGGYVPQDLGTLDGEQYSTARGVNNAGWVVGWSGSSAFLYTSDLGMVALDDLLVPSITGYSIILARDVSNTGYIAAEAYHDGRYFPVLLVPDSPPSGTMPTPEPATIVLFGSALAGGWFIKKRPLF